MKWIIFLLFFSFYFLKTVRSQDSLRVKTADSTHKLYKVSLSTFQNQKSTGYLMAIRDSSAYLLPFLYHGDKIHKHAANYYDQADWDAFRYKEIESIHVRHPAVKIISIIGGFVIGSIAGSVIGMSSTHVNDWNELYKPMNNGAIGFLIGGILGAGAGWVVYSAFEKKYMINGDWKTLQEVKSTLKD